MKTHREQWREHNNALLRRMDGWRETYTCQNNCKEWQRYEQEDGQGWCKHLVNTQAKKFDKEISESIHILTNGLF